MKRTGFQKDASTSVYDEIGVVDRVVYQGFEWRISARGSHWTGVSTTPMRAEVGNLVRIVGTQGIRLLVELIEVHSPQS